MDPDWILESSLQRRFLPRKYAATAHFCLTSSAIVIAQLRDQDLIADLPVNNSMLRSNPARPIALQRMFKRLRFADAAIGRAHHVFDKQIASLPRVWVSFLPVEIFLP